MAKSAPWLDALDAYKGGPEPPPALLSGGYIAGMAFTAAVYACLPPLGSSSSLILVAKCLPLVGLLFFLETHWTVNLRVKLSARASFSPAGAQATGQTPYEITEANRCPQNQIESACYFLPALVGAAAFCDARAPYDARLIPALVISWFAARTCYRLGYKSTSNPHRRLVGHMWSLVVSVQPLAYALFRLFSDTLSGSL